MTSGRELLKMTWRTSEDFAARLLPYLLPIVTGRPVPDGVKEAVEKPYRVKRVKKPHGRT